MERVRWTTEGRATAHALVTSRLAVSRSMSITAGLVRRRDGATHPASQKGR